MSRRNLPRDANITAAANVGKRETYTDPKLSIEGVLAGPPQTREKREEALQVATFVHQHPERFGAAYGQLGAIGDVIRALGLDLLRDPTPTAPAEPVGPMSVACPACGSIPKKRCRSVNGIERGGVHIARRRLAEQHTEEAAA